LCAAIAATSALGPGIAVPLMAVISSPARRLASGAALADATPVARLERDRAPEERGRTAVAVGPAPIIPPAGHDPRR
jgi:hypothetical protein